MPLAVSTRTPSRMIKPTTASKSINSIVLQVERHGHGYSPNLKGSTSDSEESPLALTEQPVAHWQAGSLSASDAGGHRYYESYNHHYTTSK